ncbi:condensation domain-containing protein, partial [Duganella sp. CT11-72]|uniref:condensation domain-containing protein n=1 Tax=Duganella sp. CT11-72 TaxID=3243052 RepID=UPI0039B0301E
EAPISLADRNTALPLSWAQQRLWFLDRMDPAAGAAYHMPARLRLRGRLDADALRAALTRIVARHEVLRTRFVEQAGQPAQQIDAPAAFALAVSDLRALAGHEQASAVERYSVDEASAPFDLARGPLIRGQLLRLAEEEHVLLLTQHHIVSDGWSVGLLVEEVRTLYTAFSQGQADPLPPLAVQYADYAQWQRGWLQGELLERQLAFWRGHLGGAPSLLELPLDRPRPAQQSYAGGALPVRLPAALADGLRQLARREGATLFMALLAGWSVLLSRLSGQGEVVTGTPVANRQRGDVTNLIGFFINTLALRVTLEDDPTVAQLLARVKASTLEAYSHQDVAFEQVVEALKPPRSTSHSPVFQVMLSLNNTPARSLTLPDLTLDSMPQDGNSAQFELSLVLEEYDGSLHGSLTYASALFDASTVARFIQYFETILAGMVADAQQVVSRLPLLDPAGLAQLAGFNATAHPYPSRLVHELFEEQVARDGAATALVCGAERLSYAQLNQRANRLAHHLRALGIGPDERVAICVERSVEMVVGLLAILKAGGAYVPLDPDYPAERLAYMLADSAPRALLTHSALRDRLAAGAVPVLELDGLEAALAGLPDTNPERGALRPDHLAYVIYTSGSTGQPKGA